MATSSSKRGARFKHFASVALVWVALIAVGRAVRPDDSHAGVTTLPSGVAVATRTYGAEHQSLSERAAVVGTLAGSDYRVTVYATPEGTRYSVADATGKDLARMLDEKALAATFPSLDIRTLRAGAGNARVMSAEGADDR